MDLLRYISNTYDPIKQFKFIKYLYKVLIDFKTLSILE